MSASNSRIQFDEKTKTETVKKILSGEMTIQQAMAKLSVQSYQLHAWIGYVVMEQAQTTRAVPAEIARRMAEVPPVSHSHSPLGPAMSDRRAIVEWYIRNVVLTGRDDDGPLPPPA